MISSSRNLWTYLSTVTSYADKLLPQTVKNALPEVPVQRKDDMKQEIVNPTDAHARGKASGEAVSGLGGRVGVHHVDVRKQHSGSRKQPTQRYDHVGMSRAFGAIRRQSTGCVERSARR